MTDDSQQEDSRITRRLIEAGVDAKTTVWRQVEADYQPGLLALARYSLGPAALRHTDPEDIVQIAWFELNRYLREGTFEDRGAGSVLGFLRSRIRQRAKDAGRRAARGALEDASLSRIADARLGLDPNVRERAEIAARQLLDPRLPRDLAEVLVSVRLEQKSFERIAWAEGVKPDSIRRRLARAMQAFEDIHGSDLGV